VKSLLAAVDFSDVTEGVMAVVASLARDLGAEVRVVHVAEPDPEFVGYDVDSSALRDVHAREYREEHRQLQALADRLREQGIDAKALLIRGSTVEKIAEEAERVDADLVVAGSHGHGVLHRALLGSVSEGLVRTLRRPVLIVPARRA
jgi:nucleotide-binding universal stress UspA family protein